jgi:hypothetical protein
MFNLAGISGIAPIVELDVDAKGKFLKGKIYSTRQPGQGGPVMDENNGALKEIIKLTASDIPECKLSITDNGDIIPGK